MDNIEMLAAINLLAQQMEHSPDDLHEIHLKLQLMLSELKATGMPLPEDLVELDRRLDVEIEGIEPTADPDAAG